MGEHITFETPENIEVRYELAGLGTRFIAWFTDQLILFVLLVLLFIGLMIFAGLSESVLAPLAKLLPQTDPARNNEVPLYAIGLFLVVMGLGSFVYYCASELLMRGQTLGKRSVSIRVVKLNGFALEPWSIFVRSLFRMIDHVPLLWIVPFLSQKSQRLGDWAAGTCVVIDKPHRLNSLREELAKVVQTESAFRFDLSMLRKLRPENIESVEKILERTAKLPADEKAPLIDRLCVSVAKRMNVEPPVAMSSQVLFLEELLRAEYKRQSRQV